MLSGLLFIALLIIVWDLFVRIFQIPSYMIPSPGSTWDAFWASSSYLWPALGITLYESLAGFVISIVIGIAAGTLIIYSKVVRRFGMPSLVALNATPKVALAPILILWLGLGLNSKIGMSFLLSFFPIVVNAARGLGEVDSELLDYLRLLRAKRMQVFFKARLPNSLPSMFDGFKIALPIAVVGAVIGEFVASQKGIGYQIILAYSSFDTGRVFAAVIMLAGASTLLYGLLVWAERALLRWRPPSEMA